MNDYDFVVPRVEMVVVAAVVECNNYCPKNKF
jgi:hypothetical protein